MRRWLELGPLIAVALAGCGGERDSRLGLPPAEGMGTIVFAVPEREAPRIFVADARDPQLRLDVGARDPGDPPLEAAVFAPRPAEVGLDEGWLPPAAPGVAARPLSTGDDAILGPPMGVFTADPFAASPTWVAAERLSPEIAGYRVAAPRPPCPAYARPRLATELDVAVVWGVALDDAHALIGGRPGQLRVVSADGARAVTSTVAAFSAGARFGERLFLGDRRGRVWRGQGDPAVVLRGAEPLGGRLPGQVRDIAVGGRDDVFALLADGAVHHFDGVAWRRAGAVEASAGRIESLGPGEALGLSTQAGLVYWATPDEVRPERVADTSLLSAHYSEDAGLLLGTADGELLRRRGGGLGTASDRRYGWWVVDIVPEPAGGVLFLLASGTLNAWSDATGPCDDVFTSRILSRGALVRVGDDILMVGKIPDFDRSQAYLLAPGRG